MEPIELLSEIVSINSIFPNEGKLAELLESKLSNLGFKVTRVSVSPGRFNVVGERGSRGNPVIFYGHMDTVPVYGNWSVDPFKLTEKSDRLHGLGAYDMKAGIAAILMACKSQTDRKIKVIFGVDEENISEGGWKLVEQKFVQGADAVIVPEITDDDRSNSERPNNIMLGRRGRAVYEIVVPGRSSHGAHINHGINAITEASRLVLELDKLNQKMISHPDLPKPTQFIRKISAESTSLSIPEIATLEIDRHLVNPETPESVLTQLKSDIDTMYVKKTFQPIDGKKITISIKPRKTPYLPPYTTPQNNSIVKLLSSIVKEQTGDLSYIYGSSVADENVFASIGVPVIGLGPIGASYHSADEWVSKKSYLELIKILEKFILSL